jgi:hypothetical protein
MLRCWQQQQLLLLLLPALHCQLLLVHILAAEGWHPNQ